MRQTKTSGICEFPDCEAPAIAEGAKFTVRTRFFKSTIQVVERSRGLCKKHLVQAIFQRRMPELGRSPGDGIKFPRKVFCERLKQHVTAEECFACSDSGGCQKGFNHIGCQDAFLQPSPWEKLVEKAEIEERKAS